MATAIIVIILIIIGVFSIRSYRKKLSNGCCGAGGDEVKKMPPADRDISHYLYTKTIHIDGMSCKNCANRITNAFHEKEGFYAEVNLKKKSALVRMKQPVTDKELKEIIEQTGYTVVDIKSGE